MGRMLAAGAAVVALVNALGIAPAPAPASAAGAAGAAGPDLVVTALDWGPTGLWGSPAGGDKVTFSATVTNTGSAPTPAGVVHGVAFLVDGVKVTWSDTSLDPVAPGASVTLVANGGPRGASTWTATAGPHELQAVVDDVDRIDEADEANNAAGWVGTVTTPNLLRNGGFEEDATVDTAPDGWSRNRWFVRGSKHVAVGEWAGLHRATNNAGYTVSQTVSGVTAGTSYLLWGQVNVPPTTDRFGFSIDVQWLDGRGRIIRTDPFVDVDWPTSGWYSAWSTPTSPSGARQARVRMAVQSLAASVYVDDLVLRVDDGIGPHDQD